MTAKIPIEDLVRYVDGELGDHEAQRIEGAAASDPSVEEAIRTLSAGSALLRAAFAEPTRAAPPDRLRSAIDRLIAGAESRRPSSTAQRPFRWRIPAMAAAGIAVVVLSLAGGYFAAGARIDSDLARIEALRLQDRQQFETALQRALEENVSGTTVEWSNPTTGSGGDVTPVRTFKSSDGQWCREYAYSAVVGDQVETRHAVACRGPAGAWETRIPVFVDS